MHPSIRRVVGLFALVLFLASPIVSASSSVHQPSLPLSADESAARPIHELLNSDGTLTRGISGSFDATGWRMLTDPDGAPRFVPQSDIAAAAVGWDDRFALPGVLSGEVRAIASSGTNVYVAGSFIVNHLPGANSLLRWDGRRWHAVGGGVQVWSHSGNWVHGQINTIAVSNDRVYVGGVFSHAGDVPVNNVAVWDGTRWSALGDGIRRGGNQNAAEVHAITAVGQNVYVGGTFDSAGGVAANGIARWTGSSWSALGSGVSGDIINPPGTVHAIAAYGNDLIIGGNFVSAGGQNAPNLARWNGANWSAVGGGVSNSGAPAGVYALAVEGSSLYVGGRFDRAGNVTAANIARWNGSTWAALGSGIGGAESGELPVQALAVSGGQLYVGGRFSTAGGAAATSLARWNGASWAAWGGGADGERLSVFVITPTSSGLFVGGNFHSLGGRWLSYVGRWDGAEWRAMGQGLHTAGGAGVVRAVAVSGSGEIYVGGLFDYAAETPVSNIARWDGARWHRLGAGVNGQVNAIAIDGDNVYVAGWFDHAGGQPAASIARWHAGTGTWSPLGSGINDRVNTLAIGGRWLYAGGGQAIGYLKRWNLDTNTWGSVSAEFEGPIHSLVTRGDYVFAGGNFPRIFVPGEAVIVNGVVMWDSLRDMWYYFEQGARRGVYPPYVYAIELLNNSLYVGGYFVSAGEVSAASIAEFDFGTGRWNALGSGVGGGMIHVQALEGSGTALYVGGDFDTAGGITVNNLARWDAAARTWSTLAGGVNESGFPEVNALSVSSGSVNIGGDFETTGSMRAHNFNIWHTGASAITAPVTPTGGGTLTTPDGVTVQFPAGAVTTPVTLSYAPAPQRVTLGNQWAIRGFTLEARTAEGQLVTKFLKPYTLRVSYSDSQLAPYRLTPDSLHLAYWNGSTLVALPTTVDTTAKRLTATVDHMTEFAVLGATPQLRTYVPLVRR